MGFNPQDVLMMQQRLARGAHDRAKIEVNEDAAGEGEEIERLHKPAVAWLRDNGMAHVYNRPDRKSTATPGAPDLVIVHPRGILLIEFKTKTGKLSEDQTTWHFLASRAGHKVHVIRSMAEFLTLVR